MSKYRKVNFGAEFWLPGANLQLSSREPTFSSKIGCFFILRCLQASLLILCRLLSPFLLVFHFIYVCFSLSRSLSLSPPMQSQGVAKDLTEWPHN